VTLHLLLWFAADAAAVAAAADLDVKDMGW
jgi:hypothetical protein